MLRQKPFNAFLDIVAATRAVGQAGNAEGALSALHRDGDAGGQRMRFPGAGTPENKDRPGE